MCPPDPENPNRPVFGDKDWIEKRGPIRPRRIRVPLRVKKRRKLDESSEIWFRVEGAPRRLQCSICGTARWTVITREGGMALLLCGAGHQLEVADGFYFERPKDF